MFGLIFSAQKIPNPKSGSFFVGTLRSSLPFTEGDAIKT